MSADPRARPWRYGVLAWSLAFVSMPLYVLLPQHLAGGLGVSVATVGGLLLAVRGFDAVVDPWLGRQVDAWHSQGRVAWFTRVWVLALVLALGFAAVWAAALWQPGLPALAVALLACTVSATALGLAHVSFGMRMGGDAAAQARLVGWREGVTLVGVISASVLGSSVSTPVFVALLGAGLVLGLLVLARVNWPAPADATPVQGAMQTAPVLPPSAESARPPSAESALAPNANSVTPSPHPHAAATQASDAPPHVHPLREPVFRQLLAVFMLNGIASAIPATLVMFFIRDRLGAPEGTEGLYLGAYFVAAVLSLPLWLRLIARIGLTRAWRGAMLAVLLVFVWAAFIERGQYGAYVGVCVGSGLLLGADLLVPQTLLSQRLAQLGIREAAAGQYLGWWQVATKANLALAAGLALPLLEFMGYQPGSTDDQALLALTLAYCAVPCVLKLLAYAALRRLPPDEGSPPAASSA